MQDRTIAVVPQRTTGIARLTLHPAKPRRKHFLVDSAFLSFRRVGNEEEERTHRPLWACATCPDEGDWDGGSILVNLN